MNARTRDEIGYVTCPACNGSPHTLCTDCDGRGRVLAETPRLAVQRHEGATWRTLLRVDGDKLHEAELWRESYWAEQPGNYRVVQEIDEALP